MKVAMKIAVVIVAGAITIGGAAGILNFIGKPVVDEINQNSPAYSNIAASGIGQMIIGWIVVIIMIAHKTINTMGK